MEWIIRLLGVFYILGGLFLVRSARMEWFLNKAIEKITLKPEPDRWMVAIPVTFATIYLPAGVALTALSAWGLWLLVAGMAVQAIYYPTAWFMADEDARQDRARWRSALNAGIVSAAALTLTAYAYRSGVIA